ncbi:hypothetical protein GGS24DRAFT_499021 [Hypoxylon argillaceum]|nr:hypothetical protein GGS24DRAFT_499021 [Hypoxylon argillaceum]KAI1151990.1 hypothetical protein F4825DRAFT_450966 [Nemania diffusa]
MGLILSSERTQASEGRAKARPATRHFKRKPLAPMSHLRFRRTAPSMQFAQLERLKALIIVALTLQACMRNNPSLSILLVVDYAPPPVTASVYLAINSFIPVSVFDRESSTATLLQTPTELERTVASAPL